MSFKLGILGGGNISETHARAASEIPGVEIVAHHGWNAAKTESLAKRFGGTHYSELESFLRHPDMEVVLVGSPSGLHAEQAIAAARRGLHVLVEKPLDISTARVDELLEACERAGVKLGVFFQDRAAPDVIWLKRFIDSGGLGSLFLVSAQVKWYRPPEYYAGSRWRGTWALDGGGALMNQGVHTVDLLLWLVGQVERVYARTRTALHEIEVEDTAVACLEFAGGGIGTLEATTAAHPGFDRRLELTGTAGTVILQKNRVHAVHLRSALEARPGGEPDRNPSATSPQVSDVRGHRAVIEDFFQAIRAGTEPLCSGREARRSVELVEAIYRSARIGEVVEVGRTPEVPVQRRNER
jgi:UDP-N-acetyl-2-amino-2-deoxyglucuronate dehydrogenase